jgi:hypothetical protein
MGPRARLHMASSRNPVICTMAQSAVGLGFVYPWCRHSCKGHLCRLCSQQIRSNPPQRRKKLQTHDAVFYFVKQHNYFCIKCYETSAPSVTPRKQHLTNRQSGINYVLSCSLQRLVEILFAVTNIQRKGTHGCLHAKCPISSKAEYVDEFQSPSTI